MEPAGDPFNSVVRLEESSKRPHNPMINAGAIAVTDLAPGSGLAGRLATLLAMFKGYTSHYVTVDMPPTCRSDRPATATMRWPT